MFFIMFGLAAPQISLNVPHNVPPPPGPPPGLPRPPSGPMPPLRAHSVPAGHDSRLSHPATADTKKKLKNTKK